MKYINYIIQFLFIRLTICEYRSIISMDIVDVSIGETGLTVQGCISDSHYKYR